MNRRMRERRQPLPAKPQPPAKDSEGINFTSKQVGHSLRGERERPRHVHTNKNTFFSSLPNLKIRRERFTSRTDFPSKRVARFLKSFPEFHLCGQTPSVPSVATSVPVHLRSGADPLLTTRDGDHSDHADGKTGLPQGSQGLSPLHRGSQEENQRGFPGKSVRR